MKRLAINCMYNMYDNLTRYGGYTVGNYMYNTKCILGSNSRILRRINRLSTVKVKLGIEENGYYKNMRSNRQVNLKLNSPNIFTTGIGYIIIDKSIPDKDGIYIFQDAYKQKNSVIIFEDTDDAMLFKTQLEAEVDNSALDYGEVDRPDILDICNENNFECFFYPKGSFVTPFNLKL